MRILHLPDSFFPWRTGGKEVFVLNLIHALGELGINSTVAIHSDGTDIMSPGEYYYQHVRIVVLPILKKNYINQWDRKVIDIPGFEELLEAEKFDLIHFHDQNSGASLSHLQVAKSKGIKTVLSFHSPGQSCPQRALLYKGELPCSGKLDIFKCSRCLLSIKGLPEPLPAILAAPIFKFGNPEKFKLARITNIRLLINTFINSFKEIYNLHDRIQVHAKWSKELLLINGVLEDKIFYIKQGIPNRSKVDVFKHREHCSNEILKLVFIGRCEWVKGVHVLIDAVKILPNDFPVEVHFLGPYWENSKYGYEQLNRIRSDSRFKLPQLIAPDKIYEYILDMDACVIPSLWPETGPLVLLEAFQAGLPVIGSNFGGIAEQVENNRNGFLFKTGDSKQLSRIIERFVNEPDLVEELRKSIGESRTSIDFAHEILELYKSIL